MFLFSIPSFLLLILKTRILSMKSVLVINLKIITPKTTYFQTETWYFSTHHLMCNTLYHSVTTFWKPGVCIFSTKCSFGAPTGYPAIKCKCNKRDLYHAKLAWGINVRFFPSCTKIPPVLLWMVLIIKNNDDQLLFQERKYEKI